MKRHITVIPGWFTDAYGQGGGIFFAEQARLMRERGWDVKVLFADINLQNAWPRQVDFVIESGLPILRYRAWGVPKLERLTIWLWQREYLRAFNLYQQRWGRPILIHAHNYLGGLAAAAIYRRHGIPYLLTEHSGKISRGPQVLPPRIQRAIRLAYRPAAGLYAVSEQLGDSMEVIAGRSIDGLLPNQVNTDFFTLPTHPVSDSSYFQLVSIGDPWHTKGLDILIIALGIASRKTTIPLRLVLADEIPGRKDLEPMIDQWGLNKVVHFAGKLSREQIRTLLWESNALVSASRYESFGITQIEALACGRPVLSTKTAGGREIVAAGRNGYLMNIGDPEDLSEGILCLIANYRNFDPLQLRKGVVEKYSYRAVGDRLEWAYRKVLETQC